MNNSSFRISLAMASTPCPLVQTQMKLTICGGAFYFVRLEVRIQVGANDRVFLPQEPLPEG